MSPLRRPPCGRPHSPLDPGFHHERRLHSCFEVAECLLQAHLCIEVDPLGANVRDLCRAQHQAIRCPGRERPRRRVDPLAFGAEHRFAACERLAAGFAIGKRAATWKQLCSRPS